jgi:hypothetical protein
MVTLKNLVESIIKDTFQGHKEPIDIKYDGDTRRSFASFEVQFVDGFSKSLAVQFILNAIVELVWGFQAKREPFLGVWADTLKGVS